jgi:hypothetical protein
LGFKVQLPVAFKGSRFNCLRRSRFNVQLPVAFKVQGSIACGVQRFKVHELWNFSFSLSKFWGFNRLVSPLLVALSYFTLPLVSFPITQHFLPD